MSDHSHVKRSSRPGRVSPTWIAPRAALDNAVGGRWYDAVPGRPAIDHLADAQLAAAVAVAERIAREGVPLLEELDANSLRWRGKRPKRRAA